MEPQRVAVGVRQPCRMEPDVPKGEGEEGGECGA